MAAGLAAVQAPAVDGPGESRRANPCSKAAPVGRRTGGRMARGDPSDAVISRQASSGTHSRTAPRSGAAHPAAWVSGGLAGWTAGGNCQKPYGRRPRHLDRGPERSQS